MNIFSPVELISNYSDAGVKKTQYACHKIFLMGVLAGFLIAMGGAVSNTASYSITNVSLIRLVSGLLFPFGLAIVILMGAELFTGNCLISISVLDGKTGFGAMLRNWLFAYLGNFVGAIIVAVGCALFGQLNYSDGGLAVFTVKLAAAKCSLPFGNAVVMGFFCNVLVCLGVLCSLSAKDTAGRIMGAYIPVAFFVFCGFEHCIANMYYIPAGLFALSNSSYVQKVSELGINTGNLTWGAFFIRNLLPVTIGNILGGVSVGILMWVCYLRTGRKAAICNETSNANL